MTPDKYQQVLALVDWSFSSDPNNRRTNIFKAAAKIANTGSDELKLMFNKEYNTHHPNQAITYFQGIQYWHNK